MPIPVVCPGCNKKFSAPDAAAGRKAKCPTCAGPIEIPQPAAKGDVASFLDALESPAAAKTAAPSSTDDGDFDYNVAPEEPAPKPASRVWSPSDPFAGRSTSGGSTFAGTTSGGTRPGAPEWKATERPIPLLPPAIQDRLYWLWLVALVPLVIMTFFPAPSIEERIRQYFEENPALREKIAAAVKATPEADKEDLFEAAMPDDRLPGAHVGQDSLVHWTYAGISAVCFTVLILLMFRSYDVSWWLPIALAAGVGTAGILMLLAFQYIALNVAAGGFPRVRGIWALVIVAILFFIGWSYRCALQDDSPPLVSFFGFTCGVGLCEEFIKALPIWMFMKANPQCDWRAAVIVGLACGVGFGVSEGISYSRDGYNGVATGMIYLVRFTSCVALHSIWSGAVAMIMFGERAQHEEHEGIASIAISIVKYVLIAMVLHGLYDTLLKHEQGLLALLVAIASFAWFAWLISVREAADPTPSVA